MSDVYYRQILGVTRDASREEIRSAYRQRVMENHPDRFPVDMKPLQELATITLNEAYHALMGAPGARSPGQRVQTDTHQPASETRPQPAPPRQQATPAPRSALARHRDPGYAYYKQGFINYSLAVHGIADVNRHISAGRVPRFTRRYTATEYFGSSLAFLRAAYGYFTRVADRYPDSVWASDSRWKLYRIEQYTRLYRRILRNLTGKESR